MPVTNLADRFSGMTHRDKHPEPQPDCFACKVASINWGIVPGAYRDTTSGTMYDRESIAADGIPTMEEVNDRRATAKRILAENE